MSKDRETAVDSTGVRRKLYSLPDDVRRPIMDHVTGTLEADGFTMAGGIRNYADYMRELYARYSRVLHEINNQPTSEQ